MEFARGCSINTLNSFNAQYLTLLFQLLFLALRTQVADLADGRLSGLQRYLIQSLGIQRTVVNATADGK